MSQWTHVSERLPLRDMSVVVRGGPHLSTKSEPQFCSPKSVTKATPGASITWMAPLRPDLFNIEILQKLPPRGSSASKIASKNHRILNKRYRRGGEFVFVRAANILCKGLDPGILPGCAICTADTDNQDSWVHYCGTAIIERGLG